MIRQADKKDIPILAKLAVLLWPGHTIADLEQEFADILEQKDAAFLIKYEEEIPVGFAQCQLRHDYVEGTDSSPVGYLEGIFVREEYRHRKYAKELLNACEKWAASMGCREFASDCEVDNTGSLNFHLSMGFAEANRIICFSKKL